ncbi:MAG TPA: hypothetical protein PKY60_15025 [Thermoflexales bacterium]|nr:hypothetical protein [Thermoflexales bacterium]
MKTNWVRSIRISNRDAIVSRSIRRKSGLETIKRTYRRISAASQGRIKKVQP